MTSTQQQIDKLENEISDLKNYFSDQLDKKPSNGHSNTIFDKEMIQKKALDAGKEVRNTIKKRRKQLMRKKEECETAIKQRPLTSAAIAFGTGALLIGLLKR